MLLDKHGKNIKGSKEHQAFTNPNPIEPPEYDFDVPQSEIVKMGKFILKMWEDNPKVVPGKHHVFIGTEVIPRSMYEAGEAFANTITLAAEKAGIPKIFFLKSLISKDEYSSD